MHWKPYFLMKNVLVILTHHCLTETEHSVVLSASSQKRGPLSMSSPGTLLEFIFVFLFIFNVDLRDETRYQIG